MNKLLLFLGFIACLVCAGCRSPNVNPSVARVGTGYVDFYTESNAELSWRVKRADENGGEMRTMFLDYKPIAGNVLRLAAPPGSYRFEVWFNNQVTEGPETVIVPVADGKVTPVRVTLTTAGSAAVRAETKEYRPTARMTRQVPRITTQDNAMFHIEPVAEAPQAYQPKQQMPYYAKDSSR